MSSRISISVARRNLTNKAIVAIVGCLFLTAIGFTANAGATGSPHSSSKSLGAHARKNSSFTEKRSSLDRQAEPQNSDSIRESQSFRRQKQSSKSISKVPFIIFGAVGLTAVVGIFGGLAALTHYLYTHPPQYEAGATDLSSDGKLMYASVNRSSTVGNMPGDKRGIIWAINTETNEVTKPLGGNDEFNTWDAVNTISPVKDIAFSPADPNSAYALTVNGLTKIDTTKNRLVGDTVTFGNNGDETKALYLQPGGEANGYVTGVNSAGKNIVWRVKLNDKRPEIVESFELQAEPVNLSFSATGSVMYSFERTKIETFDTNSPAKPVAVIEVANGAGGLTSRDGKTLFVAGCSTTAEAKTSTGIGFVPVLDSNNMSTINILGGENCVDTDHRFALAPTSQTLYVGRQNEITAIDPTQRQVVGNKITANGSVRNLEISPDESKLYATVVNGKAAEVGVFDTKSQSLTTTIAIPISPTRSGY